MVQLFQLVGLRQLLHTVLQRTDGGSSGIAVRLCHGLQRADSGQSKPDRAGAADQRTADGSIGQAEAVHAQAEMSNRSASTHGPPVRGFIGGIGEAG